jgi:hypothetical protein
MKTKTLFLTILLALVFLPGKSQEKSKKELKEEKKLEKMKQVESMMNTKEFRFVGKTALPSGMRSVNLSSNPNYMKFQPEMIVSEMPFFGKAYGAVGYGNDTGVKFKGKPEKYDVVKTSKNFEIEAEVKGTSDTFRVSVTVGFEGNASLSITSNSRSTITYQGDIFPLEEQ